MGPRNSCPHFFVRTHDRRLRNSFFVRETCSYRRADRTSALRQVASTAAAAQEKPSGPRVNPTITRRRVCRRKRGHCSCGVHPVSSWFERCWCACSMLLGSVCSLRVQAATPPYALCAAPPALLHLPCSRLHAQSIPPSSRTQLNVSELNSDPGVVLRV